MRIAGGSNASESGATSGAAAGAVPQRTLEHSSPVRAEQGAGLTPWQPGTDLRGLGSRLMAVSLYNRPTSIQNNRENAKICTGCARAADARTPLKINALFNATRARLPLDARPCPSRRERPTQHRSTSPPLPRVRPLRTCAQLARELGVEHPSRTHASLLPAATAALPRPGAPRARPSAPRQPPPPRRRVLPPRRGAAEHHRPRRTRHRLNAVTRGALRRPCAPASPSSPLA